METGNKPGTRTNISTKQEAKAPWRSTLILQRARLSGGPEKLSFLLTVPQDRGFPGGASGKESLCQCRSHRRHGFHPWVGNIPWRRKWQPTPVLLPGKSHGQRSLGGRSPQGCKELETSEQLNTHAEAGAPWADPVAQKCFLLSRSTSESRKLGGTKCWTQVKWGCAMRK